MGSGTARFALLLLLLSGPACWLVPPARGEVCEPGTVISGEPAIAKDLLQARLEALGGEGDWEVTRASQCVDEKRSGKCSSVASSVVAWESAGVDAMLAVGNAFRNVSRQQKSALRFVERKDYGEALQVLLRSVVVLIFPHQEVGFLRKWHQGLAMPGALYRKPRLAIGGALVLAAECQLEIGQEDHEPKDLENAHHFLTMAAALLASDGSQKNAAALSLLKQISNLRSKATKSLQEIFDLLEKVGGSASGRGLKQPDIRNLIASLSMVDKNLECNSASDAGKVQECLLSAISSIAEMLPPILLKELNIPWAKGSRIPTCKGVDGTSVLGGCFGRREKYDSELISTPQCTHESSECLFNVHRILYGGEKKDHRSAKLRRGDKNKGTSAAVVQLGKSDVRIGDIVRTDQCEEALDGSLGHIGNGEWHGDQGDVHERKPRHISKVTGMQLGYVATGIGTPSTDFAGSEPWALPLTMDSGVLVRKNHVETCPTGDCLGEVDIFESWSADDLGLIEQYISSFLDRSVLDNELHTGKEEAPSYMGIHVRNAVDKVRFLPQDVHLINTDKGEEFGSESYGSESQNYNKHASKHKSYGFFRNRNSGEYHFNWREFWRDLEKKEIFIVAVGLVGFIGLIYLYNHEPMGRLFQYFFFPITRAPSYAKVSCVAPDAHHDRGAAKYEKTGPGGKVHQRDDGINTLLSSGKPMGSVQGPKHKKGRSKGPRSAAQQKSPITQAESKIVTSRRVNDIPAEPNLKPEKRWTPVGNNQKSKWDWQEVGPGGRIAKRKDTGSGKKSIASVQTGRNERPEQKSKKILKPGGDLSSQSNKEQKANQRPHKIPPGCQPDTVNGSISWFSGNAVRSGKDIKSTTKVADTNRVSRSCRQVQHGHSYPNEATVPSKRSQNILVPPSTVLSALDPAVQEPKSDRAMVAGVIGELINHRNQYIDDGTPKTCATPAFPSIPSFSRSQSLTAGHQIECFHALQTTSIGDVPTPYPGVSMPAALHQRAASLPGTTLSRGSNGALLGIEDHGGRQHGSGDLSQPYGVHHKFGRSIWSVGPNPSIWSSNLGLQVPSHCHGKPGGDPVHGSELTDMSEDLADRLPKSLLSDQ